MQGLVQFRRGVVITPSPTEEQRVSLRGVLEEAVPGDETQDFLVLARLMYRVLSEVPTARKWPVVRLTHGHSLWRAVVLESTEEEAGALVRTSDEDTLAASNVARWLLGLPQQSSLMWPVFAEEGVFPSPEARGEAGSGGAVPNPRSSSELPAGVPRADPADPEVSKRRRRRRSRSG